jgi:hypothetical protein
MAEAKFTPCYYYIMRWAVFNIRPTNIAQYPSIPRASTSQLFDFRRNNNKATKLCPIMPCGMPFVFALACGEWYN